MGEGFLSVARGVGMAALGVTGFMSAAKKLIDAKIDANLGAVAAAAGASTQALFSYEQVVARLGGSAADADSAFATLSKRMEDLKNGNAGDTPEILGKLAALSHTNLDFDKFTHEGRDAQMRDTLDMLNKLEPADRAYWGQKFGFTQEFLKLAALQHDELTRQLADTNTRTQADIDAAKKIQSSWTKAGQVIETFWTKSRTLGVEFFAWGDSKWSQMAHGIEAVAPDMEAVFKKAFTGAFDWLKGEFTWLDDKLKSLGGSVHDVLTAHGIDVGAPTASDPASSATATGNGSSLFGNWWRSRKKANAVPYSNAGNPGAQSHTLLSMLGEPTATSAAGNTPGTSTPTATVGGDALRAAGSGVLDALRAVIAPGESGRLGYNAANVPSRGKDGSLHYSATGQYDLEHMTIDQVQALQAQRKVFAAGKWQIIPETMAGLKETMGLTGSEMFDKTMQDKMFDGLAMQKSSVAKFIKGVGSSLNAAASGLSEIWASMPDPFKGGKSHYESAVNHASIPMQSVQMALQAGRDRYAAQQNTTNSANHNNQTVFNGGVHITTAATNNQDIAKDFHAKVRDQYQQAFYANHGLS